MAKETVRTRILVPGDVPPSEDFYAKRSGSEAREPLNNTAFRQAERKYKAAGADLGDAYDFSNPNELPSDAKVIGSWTRSDGHTRPVYGIEGVDGFIHVPEALTPEEQLHFATRSFRDYPAKPNSSNLDAHFGTPPEGFFSHFQNQREFPVFNKTKNMPEVVCFKDLETRFIRKLRWITLGYQYNWTTKEYNFDEADQAIEFPQDLGLWTQNAAKQLGFGPDYRPEAGIVNFYQVDDFLTGHVDRSERNMHAPLFSISIGLSAVFLLGGLGRDDNPVRGIIVKSGDLSILSGSSRHLFHGVPKILPSQSMELSDLDAEDPDLQTTLKLLRNCRLNINVRQVI